MPTITAQTIVSQAQTILQDPTATRWSEPELLGWLNAGQREIAALRPDSTTVTTTMSTTAGSRQTVPSSYIGLVDVIRTVGGSAVRKVPRELLDAQRPGWHSDSSGTAKNYTYDPRTPKVFYVYPPSAGGQTLEIKAQATATDCANLAAAITVDDTFANALVDYVVFRAYAKDNEMAGNEGRAAAARASFENSLGLKAAADAAAAPKTMAGAA